MKLTAKEMAKRNNWDVFLNRVIEGGEFRLLSKDGETIKVAKEAALLAAIQNREFTGTPYQRGPSIFIPTICGKSVLLTKIFKDKEFGGIETGKQHTERQEQGLIDIINCSASAANSLALITEHSRLENVISARKEEGVNKYGKEPYADLVITTKEKSIKISAKGPKAPSVAGGGLAGIINVKPEIVEDALTIAHEFYETNYSHLVGATIPQNGIPEVYVQVSCEHVMDLLKGTPEMGGPIDYMYCGPMNINSRQEGAELHISGKLIPIDQFAADVESLYVRIRRRRVSQALTLHKRDKQGFLSIFYEEGEGHRRIVIVKKSDIPKSAKLISDGVYIANEK
jgi:hypothetical protein